MNLNKALCEKAQEVPLLIWNNEQSILWKSLVDIDLVDENDMTAFTEFAKYFADYYSKYHNFPTIKKLMIGLNL